MAYKNVTGNHNNVSDNTQTSDDLIKQAYVDQIRIFQKSLDLFSRNLFGGIILKTTISGTVNPR